MSASSRRYTDTDQSDSSAVTDRSRAVDTDDLSVANEADRPKLRRLLLRHVKQLADSGGPDLTGALAAWGMSVQERAEGRVEANLVGEVGYMLGGSHLDTDGMPQEMVDTAAQVIGNVERAFTKLQSLAEVSLGMVESLDKLASAANAKPPKKLPEPDDVLDPEQVAEVLSKEGKPFSPRTVVELCARGDIPGARKVGRQWRIPGWGVRQMMGVGPDKKGSR